MIHLPSESGEEAARTVIVGRTGTGKTVSGLFLLSRYDLEDDPWILFNFKNDRHLNSLRNVREIDWDFVPSKKDHGLFMLRPHPANCRGKGSKMEEYLYKLWERTRIGLFVDEMLVVGENDAMNLILTQGRSLEMPVIGCTQRPVGITRWSFSEAQFIQCFDLNDDRDIETVESFTPLDWAEEKPLGKHQSWWYDIAENEMVRWNPVPNMTETRAVLDAKLHRSWITI